MARRPASDNDLQLMLLRTSKPVRVGRRGVTLRLHGLELDFYTPELVNMRMKEKFMFGTTRKICPACASTIWKTASCV